MSDYFDPPDYIHELNTKAFELQFEDWAEQNRFWYKCAKVWKCVAMKYWRKDYYDVNRMDLEELDETATQRKELLVKDDAYYRHSGGCPCCEMIFENVYRHTADCELAELWRWINGHGRTHATTICTGKRG